MSAITKERIKLFIKNPLDNGLTRGEQMELARIALASLEAEPVAVNDDMAYAFHHALSDSSLGADEVEEIKAGLRAAFANVTIQPEPVVPAVLERLRTIVADPRALPRRKEWVSGQQYSYVLLENVEAMVDEACRAAMLQGSQPVSQTYKLNELSGNSPVTPDGWVMVPKKLTAENGAKGVLSGEFSETTFISCPECFGDDDCDTCDGSGRIEIKVPVTWTTIKSIWDKGIAHFAAKPPQEVNRG